MANRVITINPPEILLKIQTNPTEVFLDINMQSTAEKLKIKKLVNVNAIKNSLNNIFNWKKGERVLNPNFGSDLRLYLYDGITDFNTEQIISEIKDCVSTFEPRISITNVFNVSDNNDTENNTIHLKIIYTIAGLNTELFEYDYIQ